MESYVYIDGKKYRRGYTTGTTATAAAMAAVSYVLGDDALAVMDVMLPAGNHLQIPVYYGEQVGHAYAVKDGGDDIDQTNGLEIHAAAELIAENEIQILGGFGVGVVTKPGLQVAVGEPAINPVPRRMLQDNLRKLIGDGKGVRVTLSIPRGEEVAKKTFNPKLGIVGGISIIGTTGIVEPMSEEAWKKSLEIELKQLKLQGGDHVVLVPGNHGQRFAIQRLGVQEKDVVTMSNFVGYMLMEAVREGFKTACLVGHIGKLVKVSSGIFHTHSRVADGRTDAICAALAKLRAPYELIDQVSEANTTDEASDIILDAGFGEVFQHLAEAAALRATEHTYGELKVEVVLYDMKGRLLGSTLKSSDGHMAP